MKKITLLLTIICASQLYSMEPENIGGLPKELKNQIIKATITSTTDVDEAISTIKNLSTMFDNFFDDPDYFTKVVLTLADRFSIYGHKNIDPLEVVKKFNTPMAKKYLGAYGTLREAVKLSDDKSLLILYFKPLLAKHPGIAKVDPKILFIASSISNNTIEIIQLLLENGANPYGKNDLGKTFAEYTNLKQEYSHDFELWAQIKSLVDEAIQKQLPDSLDELANAENTSNEYEHSLAILGLSHDATQSDIRKAYLTLAKKFHPDRWSDKSVNEQKAAKLVFKLIQNAYDILKNK